MSNPALQSILIIGGGTAGWMTAAALANQVQKNCRITLIESDDIGTIGVGEATIPPIITFNQMLGVSERDFLRETKASFKLGIEFVNWGRQGHRYFHPFGSHARNFDTVALHHYWLDAHKRGKAAALEEYCMAWGAAKAHKFAHPSQDPRSILSTFAYAYHFDAGLYARFLRKTAEARGVVRVEGQIADVQLHPETGFVTGVTLHDGTQHTADLYIDCSGMHALLIEGALKTGYEDWSHWIPNDRALAVPSENAGAFLPYTRSTAHAAGWQWRIPLQHRTGNGHVYSSAHMSDDEAARVLLAHVEGKPLAEPRSIKFKTGMRKKHWVKNVIAIGLSSGFIEPLESTSIHLIQANISKLLALFPDKNFDPQVIDEYNRIATGETERIRDFIILHYKLNTRTDSAYWRDCAAMAVPADLQLKIDHFKKYGRLVARDLDLFGPPSWLAVHIGQEHFPDALDPLHAHRAVEGDAWLEKVQQAITHEAARMPTHAAFIQKTIG
jgi:tryptophan 7-halogenase